MSNLFAKVHFDPTRKGGNTGGGETIPVLVSIDRINEVGAAKAFEETTGHPSGQITQVDLDQAYNQNGSLATIREIISSLAEEVESPAEAPIILPAEAEVILPDEAPLIVPDEEDAQIVADEQ